MSKKLLYTLFLLVFIPYIINAQISVPSKDVKAYKGGAFKDIPLPNSAKKINVAEYPVRNNPNGDTVATTTYGVFTNTTLRPLITFWNGVPQMSPMIYPSQEGNRAVTYVRPEGGVYKQTEVPMGTTNNRSGWGMIDVSRAGSYAGTIGIVAHQPNYLFLWDSNNNSFVKSSEINQEFYPSFAFSGDNVFLSTSTSERTVPYKFYKTEDLGTTFTLYDSINHYSPSQIFWRENASTEVDMSRSPDEKYIVYAGTNYAAGGDTLAKVFNGFSPDSADNVWILYSTDSGASWNPELIAPDGFINLVDNYPVPYYAPLFLYTSEVTSAVANDGIVHIVANGYGLTFTRTDSGLVYEGNKAFPILYWNSNTKIWKSISSVAIDTLQNLYNIWASKPSGRNLALGQSYPALSVSEDGRLLLCTWTGPQITNGKIDSVNNEMYLDTYYAYSGDGGDNWTYGGVLNGKKDVAEAFCHPARMLEQTDAGYIAHLFYLEAPPTPFLSTTGTGPVCNLIYRKFNLTLTDVKDKPVANVTKFDLGQNYPNPFNPVTSIKYSVPQNSLVTLKVYDVLGREVRTLVNEVKNAGSYNVSFNASELASGLYIYTLRAGNNTLTKKMMLLK